MSRYLILVLLNIPLISLAILNTIISRKLRKSSRKRAVAKIVFWIGVLVGLILVEPIYTFLYSEGLTQTEALSLFDVLLISSSIGLFYLLNQAYLKIDAIERRLNDLHQEVSIRLSKN